MSSVFQEMLLAVTGLSQEKFAQNMVEQYLQGNTTLDREGMTLTIPKNMSLEQAISFLKRKQEEEESYVKVLEDIEAFPLDAAYCMTLVLKDLFGFSADVAGNFDTPFGPVTYNPRFLSVPISHKEKVQVPWGNISIPGVEGTVRSDFFVKDNSRVMYRLSAEVKGKCKKVILELATALRNKLKTHSIFKGKAVKVTFRDTDGSPLFFDPTVMPTFFDVSEDPVVILNEDVETQLQATLYNPIRYPDKLRKAGLSLRRTVLLSGTYGSGKTLTAKKVAYEGTKNGWTYFYVDDCRDLAKAMNLAEQYAPAVVVAEDVDRVMDGDRNSASDALSYALDGVDTKTREIILILTTNRVDAIQPLFLRARRINSVVNVDTPNSETVYRLLDLYSNGTLHGSKTDFMEAINPMLGQSSSFIHEVVDLAKLSAISRDEDLQITPLDVKTSVAILMNHANLLNKKTKSPTKEIRLTDLWVTPTEEHSEEEVVAS